MASTPKPYGRIYVIRNTINGKVYVGQTIVSLRKRWDLHRFYSRKKGRENRPFSNAIAKYGEAAFEITEIGSALTQPVLDALEIAFIRMYRSNDRRFGYNISSGGHSSGRHSEETKQRISAAHKGRVFTEEWKQNIAAEHSRRTPEEKKAWRRKLSEAAKARTTPSPMLGKTLPEETKRKISATRIERGCGIGRRCSDENKLKQANYKAAWWALVKEWGYGKHARRNQ